MRSPIAHVEGAEGHYALAPPVDLGLVERVELDPGAAAFAVERASRYLETLCAARCAVRRLNALQTLLRRAALPSSHAWWCDR